jgi:hypothetical protein
MAERPVFLPSFDGAELVTELFFPLQWHSGFAPIQKERNVQELHASARSTGLDPLLEVSSKSEKVSGRHLSAFHLKVRSNDFGLIPLECAFQGAKIFERGGPYRDLFAKDPREAKRDVRLKESGALTGFEFEGKNFPLEPKTLFYDWLYINSVYQHREWLTRLCGYAGFTDIEFNPNRSINCQARSIALFLSLLKRNLLDEAVQSPEDFRCILLKFNYHPDLRQTSNNQKEMFAKHS